MHKVYCCLILLLASMSSSATQLQGYGAFTALNKDWMLMALHGSANTADASIHPDRLEIKVSSEKISARRFKALWLDALAVELGTQTVQKMEPELNQFFAVMRGPLKRGDFMVIEHEAGQSHISVNYKRLAVLPSQFLTAVVQSLTGKHPPSKALKQGLTGQASVREQADVSIRFERLEPTLPRIAEVSRWARKPVQQLATQKAL